MKNGILRTAIVAFLLAMAGTMWAQDTVIVLDKKEFKELKKIYGKSYATITSAVFVREGDFSYYLLKDKYGYDHAFFNEDKKLLFKVEYGGGFRLEHTERHVSGDLTCYFLKDGDFVIGIYVKNEEKFVPIASRVINIPKREKGYVWHTPSYGNKQLWPVPASEELFRVHRTYSQYVSDGLYRIDGSLISSNRYDVFYTPLPADTQMIYMRIWDSGMSEHTAEKNGISTFDGKVVVPMDEYDGYSLVLKEEIKSGDEKYDLIRFFQVTKKKNGVEYYGAYPINEADIERYGVVPIEYADMKCKDGKLMVKKSEYSEWEEYSPNSGYVAGDRDLGEHYFRAKDYDNVIKFYAQNQSVRPWGIFYSAMAYYEKAHEIEYSILGLHYSVFDCKADYCRQNIPTYLSESSLDLDLVRTYYHQAHELFEYYLSTKDEEFAGAVSDGFQYPISGHYEDENYSDYQTLVKKHNEIQRWLSAQIADKHPEYAQYRAQYESKHAEAERRSQSDASFWSTLIGNVTEGLSRNFDGDKSATAAPVTNAQGEELAEQYYAEGVTMFNANRLDEALTAFRMCDSLRNQSLFYTGITSNTGHWIAYLLYKQGRESEAYAVDCFSYKLEPVDGTAMPREVFAADSMMIEKLVQGDLEAAYNIRYGFLENDIKIYGANHYSIASSYGWLGDFCYNIESRKNSAFGWYEKALHIYESYGDKAENHCIAMKIKMSQAALQMSQTEKAERLLPDYDSVVPKLRYLWFDVKIGMAIRKADNDEIIKTCTAFLALPESRQDTSFYIDFSSLLVDAYVAKDDLISAVDVSADICRYVGECYGTSSLKYVKAVVDRGRLLENLGRLRDAQILYLTSFQDFDFSKSDENIIERIIACRANELPEYKAFSTFFGRVIVLASNYDYSGAMGTLCQKIVLSLRENHWREHKGEQCYDVLLELYFSSRYYLAMHYYKTGNLDDAVVMFEELIELKQNSRDENYYSIKVFCGTVYFFQQKYSKALPYLEDCLQHSDDPSGQISLIVAYCYANDKGRTQKVVELCKSSYEKVRQTVLSSSLNTSQANKNYTWNVIKQSNDLFTIFANKYNGENGEMNTLAYNSLLLGKGFLLSSQIDVQKAIFNSTDTAITNLYNRVQSLYAQNAQTSSDPELYSALLNAESELMFRLSKDNDFASKFAVSTEDVQKRLTKRKVAVEFVYSQKLMDDNTQFGYYAYILRNDWKHPKWIELDIDQASLRQGNIYQDEAMTRRIWGDIIKSANLSEGDTIYFSADRDLHTVSMENMLWKDNPISTTYNMFRLSSTRELALPQNRGDIRSVVLFGGLDYTTAESASVIASSTDRAADQGLVPLPATRKEVNNIRQIFKDVASQVDVRCYTGDKGTEPQFNALSGNSPSVIHLATHGDYIANGQNSMERSVLYLAGSEAAFYGESSAPHSEDGVLTAAEIMDMDLSNVDIVVLSACNTAMGEIGTDGVEGLQRGFKNAGVRSLMMSLWPVDDRATQVLLTEFYRNWIVKGMSKHDALEAAKKTVRETPGWSDPKFWAAFILLV